MESLVHDNVFSTTARIIREKFSPWPNIFKLLEDEEKKRIQIRFESDREFWSDTDQMPLGIGVWVTGEAVAAAHHVIKIGGIFGTGVPEKNRKEVAEFLTKVNDSFAGLAGFFSLDFSDGELSRRACVFVTGADTPKELDLELESKLLGEVVFESASETVRVAPAIMMIIKGWSLDAAWAKLQAFDARGRVKQVK